MSTHGAIYSEVDASVVNSGISTLSISGESGQEGGNEFIVVWLLWQYDETTGAGGFTNISWYFNETPLKDYFSSEADFKTFLIQNKPTDLDDYLGKWIKDDKITFIGNHSELGVVDFGDPNGCIDYR